MTPHLVPVSKLITFLLVILVIIKRNSIFLVQISLYSNSEVEKDHFLKQAIILLTRLDIW